jgi:tRNA (guanosine-2'-O-)-methyltransferase
MSGTATKDMLLSERRRRIEEVVAHRTRTLAVVLEDLEDPHNIAAVLRSCEAFGVQEVHAITRHFAFHPNAKITQGAEKWLDLSLYRDSARCLSLLKERGFLLAATHLSDDAGSLLDLPIDRPLAIVFGTEKVGVSKEALALCDLRFKIPMLGFSQSLNISVAAAVCLSNLVFRKMEKRTAGGDLPAAEQEALREKFYLLSVKQRHRLEWNRNEGRASRRGDPSRNRE